MTYMYIHVHVHVFNGSVQALWLKAHISEGYKRIYRHRRVPHCIAFHLYLPSAILILLLYCILYFIFLAKKKYSGAEYKGQPFTCTGSAELHNDVSENVNEIAIRILVRKNADHICMRLEALLLTISSGNLER